MSVTIRRVRDEDHAEWFRMRQALWPDQNVDDLLADMRTWLTSDACACYVAQEDTGSLCGFLEVALRPCNVHGETGRFGYVEGWYVDPESRRRGIGKALVQAAEEWVGTQGSAWLLSDARWDNADSAAAHAALGFREAERLFHFEKRLSPG